MTKAIFIAATGQNVGKSTVCLGLISGLKKRFNKVGFIKPVGQQHVDIKKNLKVDKDVLLFQEVFHLEAGYRDMSPVIVPPGFTRRFLDRRIDHGEMKENISRSFNLIASENDYTIVEGTGHVGVGSIIDLNNAEVASNLGLDVVLISTGGLGSSFDELVLNIQMCLNKGLNVRGVILNKVLKDKRDMVLNYFPKALAKFGIPLIGCVPYSEFLNTPTMQDFAFLFDTELLSGTSNKLRHFKDKRLVACSLEAYLDEMVPNQLIITPASRRDIILAFLKKHEEEDYRGGIILTGRHKPEPDILEKIRASDVPVLYAPLYTYEAMKKITSYTAKIRREDKSKVDKAIQLVETNINFDKLCEKDYATI